MLHQLTGDRRECIARDAAQVLFGAHSRTYSLSPVPDLSGPSLVQAHLAGAIIPDTGAPCRLSDRLQRGSSNRADRDVFTAGH